jgi:DNA-binding MarR family transcriptional regulator
MTIADFEQQQGETALGLGTLLRVLYQSMMANAVEPRLASIGSGDIRSAHLPVFQSLSMSPAGLRSTELAARARISKQSMGYLIDHLSTAGYVERAPDPTDQRAKVVRLTSRGWAASRNIRAAVQAVEADWARRVGSERMEQLRATMEELAASLAT